MSWQKPSHASFVLVIRPRNPWHRPLVFSAGMPDQLVHVFLIANQPVICGLAPSRRKESPPRFELRHLALFVWFAHRPHGPAKAGRNWSRIAPQASLAFTKPSNSDFDSSQLARSLSTNWKSFR